MKRNVFVVILAIIMLFSLVGCNKESSINSHAADKQPSPAQVLEQTSEKIEEIITEKTTEASAPEVKEEVTVKKEPSTKEQQKKQTSTTSQSASSLISKNNAKEIAFKHAGVSASDVKYLKVELDRDDGRIKYEVNFYCGDFEYEYDINAETGAIISADKEYDSIYD